MLLRGQARTPANMGAVVALASAFVLAASVSCRAVWGFDELSGATDDAGVLDGGVDDAAGGDRPDAASNGDAGCAASHALLCEDFERDISTSWIVDQNDAGSLTLTGTEIHRGAKALHLHVNEIKTAQPVNIWVQIWRDVALPSEYFVRSFFYVPSPGPPSLLRFMALANLSSEVLWFRETGGHVDLEIFNAESGVRPGTTPFPSNRWVCIEFGMSTKQDGGAQTIRVWQDDQELVDLRGPDIPWRDPLSRFFLQAFFGTPAPQPAFDMFVDDVMIDSTRVGCVK